MITLFVSCQQREEGYVITGNIQGADGIVKLARLDLVTNARSDVDSTEVVDGQFEFKGKIGSPYLHTLFFNDDVNKIHFFLEDNPITITGDVRYPEKVRVSGSREDSLFHSFATDDIFDRKMGMDIMLNYPDYSFGAFTAYYQFQIFNIHPDTLRLIMDRFTPPVKQTIYYEHLQPLYETLLRVAISSPAPDFRIPDVDGNPVSLQDYDGKYVLIDFWASWCNPCRKANPELVKIHREYSGERFDILGISVDDYRDKWLAAIEQDALPWTNVSNVRGWDEITDLYGVKAVPQNFLLDPDGVIIDKNIELQSLRNTLDRVLE